MPSKPSSFIFHMLLLSTLVLLLSSTTGTKTIPWDANTKLTWADFKDTLITGSNRAAETYSGFKMDFAQTNENTATIHIFSEMDPSKSWVDSTKKNDFLLSHEQYHFNITEYWTRKLRKEVLNTKFTLKNVKEKITLLRKDAFAQCHNMQKEYDADTNHSLEVEQQKKWEKKVDELLKETEKYTETSLTVFIR